MKIIEKEQVEQLLKPAECIEIMKEALKGLEDGTFTQPQRMIAIMPNTAKFGFMPAWVGDYYGAKVLSAYAPNMGTGYPSHIGYVMLFESEHSTVAGLIDAGSITQIRTGAVSAVATLLLSRKNSHNLAFIGAGAQARSHLAAIREIRDITKVTVYDLHTEAAERFREDMEKKYSIPVTVCSSVREAVTEADIICTVSPSKEAYLTADMVKPGTHINAVGTFTPNTREAASDLIAASKLYADQISAMEKESGEYLIPLQEGLISRDHIAGSIGGLLMGRDQGRKNEEEITLFDALGLAVEDVACAKYVYEESLKGNISDGI